jgi:hypothetical protein
MHCLCYQLLGYKFLFGNHPTERPTIVEMKEEVDFVIEAGRECLALEIKSAARWREKDLSGLKSFLTATEHCKAAVLCHNGDAAVRLGAKLWALPISLILS